MATRTPSGVLAVVGSVFCGAALAQTPAAFVGTWTVTWRGQTKYLEAALSITETGGTWRTLGMSNPINPCWGLEHPIELRPDGEQQAEIIMLGSQALKGCPDFKVTMKLTDANNGTGRRGQAELTYTRR